MCMAAACGLRFRCRQSAASRARAAQFDGPPLDRKPHPVCFLAERRIDGFDIYKRVDDGAGAIEVNSAVVGWDDLAIASYTIPGLTTLRMPTHDIVAEGVRLAVELARDAGASREPCVAYFEPTLIVRESTAPPAG